MIKLPGDVLQRHSECSPKVCVVLQRGSAIPHILTHILFCHLLVTLTVKAKGSISEQQLEPEI